MSVLFWAETSDRLGVPDRSGSARRENRRSPKALLIGAIVLLLGMILNRFNVSWFAVKHPDPLTYAPNFHEQRELLSDPA